MEQWYKIVKDQDWCNQTVGLFCELHDYRITNIDYNCEFGVLDIYLEYDTTEEGVFCDLTMFLRCRLILDQSRTAKLYLI